MKNKYIFILIVFFISCNQKMTETERLNKTNPIGNYGKKISLTKNISIDTILNNPDNYIDQEVLVFGKIVDVCPMRGCWIDIKENNSDQIIKVKVKDGNIVFPISAINYDAKVEGVVKKIVYSEEQAINWKIHLAAEKGIKLDEKLVKINEADLIEYRINSLGAQIF